MNDKEQRNKRIIKMHNDGKTVREIAEAVGISKTLVNNVINAHIESLKVKPAPAVTENKLEPVQKQTAPASNVTTSGKRISSFGEYKHTGTRNEYAHKETGEIITVKFVQAKAPEQCGHFETV